MKGMTVMRAVDREVTVTIVVKENTVTVKPLDVR